MGDHSAKDGSLQHEHQLQNGLIDHQFVCYYSYLEEDYLSLSYKKKNKTILLRKFLAKQNKWTPFIVYYKLSSFGFA